MKYGHFKIEVGGNISGAEEHRAVLLVAACMSIYSGVIISLERVAGETISPIAQVGGLLTFLEQEVKRSEWI